jgi:hypothetical protein
MSGGLRSFQPGEKVGFLYEKGGGMVKIVLPDNRYRVEDGDGFERDFRGDELVKIFGEDYKLPDDAVAQINEDDSITQEHFTVRKESRTGSKRPIDVWEIDLHIEALTDSNVWMSNAEILSIQLRELRTFYSKARSKHIRKLVVIHGVGEGVLKDEVRLFLTRQEGVNYYDADFREYGKGATAVDLFYNI